MPIGRRATFRSPIYTPISSKSPEPCLHDTLVAPTLPPIRHVLFPVLSQWSVSSFYLCIISLSVAALLLQYVYLYKTVWFMVNLSTNYPPVGSPVVNFPLLGHCLNMLITPRVYLLLLQLLSSYISNHPVFCLPIATPLFASWLFLTYTLLSKISSSQHNLVHDLCCNILLLYLPLAGLLIYHWTPLLQLLNSAFCPLHFPFIQLSQPVSLSADDTPGNWCKLRRLLFRLCKLATDWPAFTPTSLLFPLRYTGVSAPSFLAEVSGYFSQITHLTVAPHSNSLQVLRHQCLLTDGDRIRDEVELFRHDFNSRLMDVFFGSLYTVYYSCLVPLLFVNPQRSFYDLSWCLQHTLFTWIAAFLLHWHHCLPSNYLDLLHQSALHLGAWHPHDLSVESATLPAWSSLKIYPKGAVIRHFGGHFRSSCPHAAAEPGNAAHSRFYLLFHSITRVEFFLLCIAISSSILQLISFKWIFEWYQLIGLIIIGLFGLFNVYIRTRDYFLTRRVYASETPYIQTCSSKREDYSLR